MILETTRGEDLYKELKKDYKKLEKEIKKKRDQIRKPYLQRNKDIPGIITENFTITTGRNNRWFVSTSMHGSSKLPKAINHFHVISNAGKEGSRLYVILRGMKTSKKAENADQGYVISVKPHVLTRMRERNPEAFGDIESNDELCKKIFTLDEIGMYYDFDWREVRPQKEELSNFPILNTGTTPLRPKKETDRPIILKTLAGVFLGFSTKDRREVRLITYIKSADCEEEREILEEFLEPCWIVYNKDKFPEKAEEAARKLQKYVEDKEDRIVYCLNY